MTKLPVLFIHFGDAPTYAAQVIAHARSFGNEVVFLNPTLDELHAHPFARVYEHLSTNHYDFELACIVRWFWLRDWMKANECPIVMYCDTDVLLYVDAAQEWANDPYYQECDLTLSLGTSGHTSYWHLDALEMFCRFLTKTYRERVETFEEMERIYAEMRAQELAGGLNDMTLLKMFANLQEGGRVGEMSIPRDGKVWDHNLNSRDGFKMNGGRKLIRFDKETPFGLEEETDTSIQFLSIHFQNGAKNLITQFADKSVGKV